MTRRHFANAPFNRGCKDTTQRVGAILLRGNRVYYIEYWNSHHTETFVVWFQNVDRWRGYVWAIGSQLHSHGSIRPNLKRAIS